MRDDLLIPGSIPGLLRRGSPVVFSADDGRRHERGDVGLVMATGGGGVLVATHRRAFVEANAASVALDLHDATGRHHALLWLAGRATTTLRHHAEWTCWPWGWDLCGFGEGEHWRSVTYLHPERHGNWSGTPVPTLADLDPTSDERLADGSRLVDALALARVVAHVAGVGRD